MAHVRVTRGKLEEYLVNLALLLGVKLNSPNVNLRGLFPTVEQYADFRTVALSRRRGHATVMFSRCEA